VGSCATEGRAIGFTPQRYHISFARAIGRRLRRTYAWIFVIQAIAYYGKLAIHPTALTSFAELSDRAIIGPIPERAGPSQRNCVAPCLFVRDHARCLR
jgi:hypothetical protein